MRFHINESAYLHWPEFHCDLHGVEAKIIRRLPHAAEPQDTLYNIQTPSGRQIWVRASELKRKRSEMDAIVSWAECPWQPGAQA